MAKELTEKQQRFLDALAENPKDQRAAARAAGYSDGTPIIQIVKGIRTEVAEVARLYLALHSPQAAYALVEGINDPSQEGIQHKIRAAEQILDRVGVVKTEKVEVNGASLGAIFLLPPKDSN